MTFRRIAGAAGILFVASFIAVIALSGEPPAPDDPVQDVVEYVSDNEGGLQALTVVNRVSGIFVAVFAAGLLSTIWRTGQRQGQAWAAVGLIGVVAAYAALDTSDLFSTTQLLSADSLAADQLTRTLHDASSTAFLMFSFNLGVFALGSGMGILTTRVAPRWLGWLALVGAGTGFLGIFALGDRELMAGLGGFAGFLTGIVFTIFVLGTAINMLRTPEVEHQPAAAAT